MLSPKLAENIVKEVRKLIGEDIIVVNTEGIIIASTDKKRVGTFHEGAKIASQEKRKLIITEEDQKRLQGVKAGINFPIFFQYDVIGVIGITGIPEKVTPFGEIIRKMTELLISENYYAEQFDQQSRAMETFIMDWVQLSEWNRNFLNRAKILAVNVAVDRMAAVVEVSGQDYIISRDIWSSIINWFVNNQNDIVIRWGNERIVILFDSSLRLSREQIHKRISKFLSFLNSKIGIPAHCGIGQVVPATELKNSFRQAERALKIAKQKHKMIIFDEELTLEMILDELNHMTKTEFIKRTIAPLLSEKELLETIKVFFQQNNSLKNTANALHVHINTLHYRLKKIEEYTNLDTKNIHDLLNMYIAVLLLDENTKNNHLSRTHSYVHP
ncbi:sugar diacid recognition domain-containing protein [Neobacillus sp. PS3-12]|jgi:carbohydrate diacid regulator|uniref:CdaR family transcriptional regulator n=1 Tax=Neobacillus sp. PS3-12 TaxID=3070677 RepID=UPI0027DEAD99|nr:sugar diacid recognition domain-containing protein [Neobacillus sp. PS3-12]WML51817.1 sugar diacid recognition domain-containing protein [Neobacillus sp. PS3-12]